MEALRTFWFILLLLLCAPLNVVSPQKSKSPSYKPNWVKQVGKYRLVHWGDSALRNRETLRLRDEKGCAIITVSEWGVRLDRIQDLTGDGVPEVIFYSWTGGAHGGYVYYVYSLGKKARNPVVYEKGNGGDGDDFMPKDLNGDRQKEIVSWDDGFAYYHASYAGSGHLPFILGYRKGRYVDVTRSYPDRIRQELAKAKTKLLEDFQEAEFKSSLHDVDGFGTAVNYYALAVLLGRAEKRKAWRELMRLLPKPDRVELRACRREIERIVARRSRKLTYIKGIGKVVKPQSLLANTSN